MLLLLSTLALVLTSCSAMTTVRDVFGAPALAQVMAGKPVVLLGEVHDNPAQHAVRAAALRQLLEAGARPAIAFEQFDRERQADVDRARRETPPAGVSLAEHVIAQATGPRDGWNWTLYRPFVELALEYDLPIVAANLSRADATRVSREGFGAVFDDAAQKQYGLDALPPALMQAQERAVDEGHCHQMPAEFLPRLARAQIARDLVLLQSIRPYFARGVVLLTGDGHVRKDFGVPFYMTEAERARSISIGLIERDQPADDLQATFDVVFLTPVHKREDPCASLQRKR